MAEIVCGAVNHWFDMKFGTAYGSGETVVKLEFKDHANARSSTAVVLNIAAAKALATELKQVIGLRRLGRNPCGSRPIARNARVAVLDPQEERAISLLGTRWSNRENMVVRGIRRKSGRQFDLDLSGEYGPPERPYNFSGWLPLMVISEARWVSPEYARLSCSPEMTRQGDWSGIRDSEEEAIWAMFEIAREELGF